MPRVLVGIRLQYGSRKEQFDGVIPKNLFDCAKLAMDAFCLQERTGFLSVRGILRECPDGEILDAEDTYGSFIELAKREALYAHLLITLDLLCFHPKAKMAPQKALCIFIDDEPLVLSCPVDASADVCKLPPKEAIVQSVPQLPPAAPSPVVLGDSLELEDDHVDETAPPEGGTSGSEQEEQSMAECSQEELTLQSVDHDIDVSDCQKDKAQNSQKQIDHDLVCHQHEKTVHRIIWYDSTPDMMEDIVVLSVMPGLKLIELRDEDGTSKWVKGWIEFLEDGVWVSQKAASLGCPRCGIQVPEESSGISYCVSCDLHFSKSRP